MLKLASGVGLLVATALRKISLHFSLVTVLTQKSFKLFTIKQEKHNTIKLLVRSKLDSIAFVMPQVMQDGDIWSIGFNKVLQKVEKYRKPKAGIRN